jgi:hypothetical protein
LEVTSISSKDPKQNKKNKKKLMIWRNKMQASVQGRLQLKDSISFKWVHISSYGCGPWTPSKVSLRI